MSQSHITYEYPLIERVRTHLRLEDIFSRADFFLARGDPHDHHVVITTMFEILDVVSRAELKSELLQELERQKHIMASFRSNPEADQHILERVVEELDRAFAALFALSGKVGQHLRENEWLMSIRQRANIPGGVCEFDLPSYHHWLHTSTEARASDLRRWLAPLYPIRNASVLLLDILRESGRPQSLVAHQGTFQQMLGGKSAQMVRLRLPRSAIEIPEISANRYALNVRFTVQGSEPRPRTADRDVDFELAFCTL